MKIEEIATQLNKLSVNFKIGNLQDIRKEVKGFKRKPGSSIFQDKTVFDYWAFHYGGRKEIQFNIGIEEEGLRYGIAFSLETSATVPDISIFFPKILKLNCLIREKPEMFQDYQMWHWQNEVRSEIREVREIHPELLSAKTFIFIGKIEQIEYPDFEKILETFDELLEIYLKIEKEEVESKYIQEIKKTGFQFDNKPRTLVEKREFSFPEREVNIDIRHTYLQQKLIEDLQKEFGKENVSFENPFYQNKIDVVVKEGSEFIFYEIKVASSVKSCIRQALGQLLEYAFWDGKKNANKIVIAGEYGLDDESESYIGFLRSNFNLPLEYRKITF